MKALTDLDEHGRATRRPQKQERAAGPARRRPVADRAAAEASLDRVLDAFTAEDASFLQRGEGTTPRSTSATRR